MDKALLTLNPEVESALLAKKPIVALESTVIAHGLPRPTNLEVARRLEQIVRGAGAVPATIAILDGKLRAGLNDDEIKLLAQAAEIKKVSIRDLPIAVAQKWNSATTVATSTWIAQRAGIKVFATGGIGGVHRGSLPDISADLPALAATPMIVVCSGAKIVLDLAATREWLETQGITVVGYGCDEMPAFYSPHSGLPVDISVNGPSEVVQLFRAQEELKLERALLVTVPVPAEFAVPADELKRTLDAALKQAEEQNISGRELTPFLLSHMAETSAGSTLKANIALLENNARVAAEIANAFAES
ncbi:MAG TPA: pseudouridine-5'-phosphate glycosidase [Pyrinomonadaceae bacterium]